MEPINYQKDIKYGLVIPKIETREEGAEHILGSSNLKGEVLNPSGNWEPWLVEREFQQKNGVETQDCTGFGWNNAIEILIKFLTGKEQNYSDRYLGICADTNPFGGNDPHKVAETIRKISGCLPELRLPFGDDIKTPEDFYKPKPVTPDLLKEGQGWWDLWTFNHEWVFEGGTVQEKQAKLKEALKRSPVALSVSAWYYDNNRHAYFKPEGSTDNHWVVLISCLENGYWRIFDSYDGFLKDLVPEYDFSIAKVFYLTDAQKELSIFAKIIEFLKQIVGIQAKLVESKVQEKVIPVIPIDQEPPAPVAAPLSKIPKWARTIQTQEGGKPGDRNMRNFNPGNIKYTEYTKSLGATSQDPQNFCVFPDYETGFKALCQFLTDAANNKLKAFHDTTLDQFTHIFAEVPLGSSYARAVASELNCPIDTPIKNLL